MTARRRAWYSAESIDNWAEAHDKKSNGIRRRHMGTHSSPSLSGAKDFSDQMDVSADEVECAEGEQSKRIGD
jgi:hypothetical protein